MVDDGGAVVDVGTGSEESGGIEVVAVTEGVF